MLLQKAFGRAQSSSFFDFGYDDPLVYEENAETGTVIAKKRDYLSECNAYLTMERNATLTIVLDDEATALTRVSVIGYAAPNLVIRSARARTAASMGSSFSYLVLNLDDVKLGSLTVDVTGAQIRASNLQVLQRIRHRKEKIR